MPLIDYINAPPYLQIAAQNDLYRRALVDPLAALDAARCRIHGPQVVTKGIAALGPAFVRKATKTVAAYDQFSEDNDPHGQRDFGCFDQPDANGTYHRVYWKIDYYDPDKERGSEDPRDPAKTCRVLPILLAEEW